MNTLVTAASKHGATPELAETIARVLEEHGLSTELAEMDKVRDLGSYDASVVESARAQALRRRAGQARSDSWRGPPSAERMRANATTATGTRSSGGRPRSLVCSALSEPDRRQGGDRRACGDA